MKVAVIGCGGIANRWIRTLLREPDVTIGVLADPLYGAAEKLAAKHGLGVPVVANIEEALTSCVADVVVNLTPPDQHVPVSRAALRAGAHVLSEKPLATDLASARDLVAEAERADRVLAVMQNRGQDPRFSEFRRASLADRITPTSVSAEVFVALQNPGFRAAGPVAVADLAIHAFDQVRRLIAAPAVSVSCAEIPLTSEGPHCSHVDAKVRFANGSIFHYRGGFIANTTRTSANGRWRAETDYCVTSWDGAAEILRHLVSWSTSGQVVDPWDQRVLLEDAPPGYEVCIADMVNAVRLGQPSVCSAAGNLGSIAILDAALQSAAGNGVMIEVSQVGGDGDAES